MPRLLPSICHKVKILNMYYSYSLALITQATEACFEVALTLLSFFSSLVKFMRFMRSDIADSLPGELHIHGAFLKTNTDIVPLGLNYNTGWRLFEQDLTSVNRKIDDCIDKISEISKNTKRSDPWNDAPQLQSTPSLSEQSFRSQPEEHADLPCVILPSIRTSRFFDRNDVISKIEEHFGEVDADRSFRSLALYGIGGVGKSTIGLSYVEAKLRRGELDALFWVHSEKPVTIRQSFTDIALRLKLPDARLTDHDENHALVLRWLQHTREWFLLQRRC